MMFGIFGAMLVSFVLGSVSAYRTPVDCAFSVWSEWRLDASGQLELRSRHVLREARNGGRDCTGQRVEYRAPGGGPESSGSEEFWGNVLAGDAPSYSLGGGKRYTLSRDIVLAKDTVVDRRVYPYYKSLISNIVGAICGEFGSRPQDHRMHIITFDNTASHTYPFSNSNNQKREVFQDVVLRTDRSPAYNSDLGDAINSARTPLVSDDSGARPYNNATKEVLLVTTYQDYCSGPLLRRAEALKSSAVVYVIVVGRGSRTNPPRNWCMENLASTPTRGHFLHLKDITEISAESRTILAQSPINHFCEASGHSN